MSGFSLAAGSQTQECDPEEQLGEQWNVNQLHGLPSPPTSSGEGLEPQFAMDALQWLILNSQNPDTTDMAICALANNKVRVDDDGVINRVNSHLVKRFSGCFNSTERGGRMEILQHQQALASALNYLDWMSCFAGDDHESITKQASRVIGVLGVETVTNLGLALASEGVLSVFIDGLTIAGRRVDTNEANSTPIEDHSSRAQILAVPSLINILWKVSHVNESASRSSIALNLAIFALTTRLPHPVNKERSGSMTEYLAYEYQSPSSRKSSFVSFVVFALLAFVHPESQLGLDEKTMTTACQIIQETNYLVEPHGEPTGIAELDALRQHLTPMLIESMLPTEPGPLGYRRHLLCTAFRDSGCADYWEGRDVQTLLHAVCELIIGHIEGPRKMHDEAFIATTTLLFREVQKLHRLDSVMIGFDERGETFSEPSTSYVNAALPGGSTASTTPERMASIAIARIIQGSGNMRSIETAVQAALIHSEKRDPDSVITAITWFASTFRAAEDYDDEDRLLCLWGYTRILIDMVVRCTDPAGLAERLFGRDTTDPEARLHKDVEEILQILAEATYDENLRSIGICSLAVWSSAFLNLTFHEDETRRTLGEVWELIIKHNEYRLHPGALEVLLDTVILLTAVTEPAIVITHLEAQTLLQLFTRFDDNVEERVRSALAATLAFCGLCLDADDRDFRTELTRLKEEWRVYLEPSTRRNETPGLCLMGSSRLLAHHESLKLDHTSIQTIADVIDRYMQPRTGSDYNPGLSVLPDFDIRKHVREYVRKYLQDTESLVSLTEPMKATQDKLGSILEYD
ncbi:hypothetical protein FRC07_002110 [Ceratobasidium sp. 392]|nr:hypothetical protein FRC07_002110 [Ceratobasidium sp. 392]